MGLKEYQNKRNFKKSPEPKGKKEKPAKKELHFVIHKHDATRLHYDLRLEHHGVLLSWAVPKGPSVNPKEKHLAIKVEDHPYDYKSFEGVIPEGNYGAGTVMIWDEGTFDLPETTDKSEAEKKLDKGLEKGEISFTLHGHKLKGDFTLVKFNKDQEENQWLLIKKNDQYASSSKKILTEDKSAVSNRTMREIASEENGASKKKAVKKQ